MNNNNPIQLSIPNPCHEDWEQMSPCEQGRFCSSCQKTVIDFSTWGDRALYEFFSKNTAHICGNITNTQLSRKIPVPYQPKSRLYRIAIACGLTLMFTQVPEAHSMVTQSIEMMESEGEVQPEEGKKNGTIQGRATDENDEPVVGAIVEVSTSGIKKGGAMTDIDGNYEIKNLPGGVYHVMGRYSSYKSINVKDVGLSETGTAHIDLNFRPQALEDVKIQYVRGLISTTGRVNTSFDASEIKNEPTPDLPKFSNTNSSLTTDKTKHEDSLSKEHKPEQKKKKIDIKEERATRTIFKEENIRYHK